jgi:hypothetical protein
MAEGQPKYKDVFAGKNPHTGRPYFKRVKISGEASCEPPSIDELPPSGVGKLNANRPLVPVDPDKMEREWDRSKSRKGRPPIGGALDD